MHNSLEADLFRAVIERGRSILADVKRHGRGPAVDLAGSHISDLLRQAREDLATSGNRALAIYVHVPLCWTRCLYCRCASKRARGGREIQEYATGLRSHLALLEPFFRDVPVSAVYVGGGSPNVLGTENLGALLRQLHSAITPAPGFQFNVEIFPRNVTSELVDVLAECGVSRVSVGVQTLTSTVLSRTGRGNQRPEDVANVVEKLHAAGSICVNLDLMAGLPGETEESFVETVAGVLALRPDSICTSHTVWEDAPTEAYGGFLDYSDASNVERQLRAADQLLSAEYEHRDVMPHVESTRWPLYVHWNGPEDVLENSYERLRWSQAATVLGVGFNAQSSLPGQGDLHSTGSPAQWLAALERGEHPPARLVPLGMDDTRAFYAALNLAWRGLRPAGFREVFGVELDATFGRQLEELREAGLVEQREGAWFCRPDAKAPEQVTLREGIFLPTETLRWVAEAPRDTDVVELPRKVLRVAPGLPCRESAELCTWSPSCGTEVWPRVDVLEGLATAREGGYESLELMTCPLAMLDDLSLWVTRAQELGLRQVVLNATGRELPASLGLDAGTAPAGQVVVVLQGPGARHHDAFTGKSGSYGNLVDALRKLSPPNSWEISAAVVLTSHNAGSAREAVEEAVRLGARQLTAIVYPDAELSWSGLADLHQTVSSDDVRFTLKRV